MEAFLTSAMLKKNSSVQHQVAKWQDGEQYGMHSILGFTS
jgi:hypothetical protein